MSSQSSANDDSRFARITENDHSGILWIASLLSGIYSVLALFARTYIKRAYFGLDDWVCSIATVMGVAAFSSIYIALSKGLGKSSELLSATQIATIGQAVFASQITFILALCLSKCAIVLLIRRLFSHDMTVHRSTCDIAIALMGLWGIASLAGLSVDCNPSGLILQDNRCLGQRLRWQIIGIVDAVSEFALVILSFALVWQLQMKTHLKVRVILAFVFRILLVPIIVGHISFLKTAGGDKQDRALALTIVIVLEQVQLAFSLISATIPNLKSFIISFDTSMMMDISHKISNTESSPPPTVSSPILSETLSKTSTTSKRPTSRMTQEDSHHTFGINSLDAVTIDREISTAGSDQEEGRLRRQFRWRVEQSGA